MRKRGKVAKFFMEKGFGFITQDDVDGPDLFLHIKNILGDGYKKVAVGDVVEYEEVFETKGPTAKEVSIISTVYKPLDKNYDNRGNV